MTNDVRSDLINNIEITIYYVETCMDCWAKTRNDKRPSDDNHTNFNDLCRADRCRLTVAHAREIKFFQTLLHIYEDILNENFDNIKQQRDYLTRVSRGLIQDKERSVELDECDEHYYKCVCDSTQERLNMVDTYINAIEC